MQAKNNASNQAIKATRQKGKPGKVNKQKEKGRKF